MLLLLGRRQKALNLLDGLLLLLDGLLLYWLLLLLHLLLLHLLDGLLLLLHRLLLLYWWLLLLLLDHTTKHRAGVVSITAKLLTGRFGAEMNSNPVETGCDPFRFIVKIPAMHDHGHYLTLVDVRTILQRIVQPRPSIIVNIRDAVGRRIDDRPAGKLVVKLVRLDGIDRPMGSRWEGAAPFAIHQAGGSKFLNLRDCRVVCLECNSKFIRGRSVIPFIRARDCVPDDDGVFDEDVFFI